MDERKKNPTTEYKNNSNSKRLYQVILLLLLLKENRAAPRYSLSIAFDFIRFSVHMYFMLCSQYMLKTLNSFS